MKLQILKKKLFILNTGWTVNETASSLTVHPVGNFIFEFTNKEIIKLNKISVVLISEKKRWKSYGLIL